MTVLTPRYQLLLLIFVALGIYYPTLFAPFNPLDDQLMVFNLLNQEEFRFRSIFMPGGASNYFRPVLALTFQVDKYLWGLEESFMHLVNMGLHALNGCLVYLVGCRLSGFFGKQDHVVPFWAALFFVIHPINTETVNWISARADLLAATFVLATLWLLLSALESRRLVYGLLAGVTFLLGTLSKETVLFMLPGVFWMFIWRRSDAEPAWRGRWLIFIFFLICVAGYFTLRANAFQSDMGGHHAATVLATAAGADRLTSPPGTSIKPAVEQTEFPLIELIRVSFKACGYYAVKLFQPLPLSFAITKVPEVYLIPGLLVGVGAVFWAIRRRPLDVFILMSIFTGSAALLVVFTGLAWTPIAERYMYIPCGIFSLAVFMGGARLLGPIRKNLACVLATAILFVVFGVASYARNLVWQDNLALYQDTLSKNPDFPLVKNQLAMLLLQSGRDQEAFTMMAGNRVGEGQRAAVNQAVAVMQLGDYDKARRLLEKQLADPGLNEVQILEKLIGITYQQIEKVEDKEQHRAYYQDILGWLKQIFARHPGGFSAYRIGRVHLLLNQRVEAQHYFAEAARLLPENSLYKKPAQKLARNLDN